MHRLMPALLLLVHLTNSASQSIHENYTSPLCRTEKKTIFFLSIEHTQFFKNNEYFNKLYKGYTLPGHHISPLTTFVADSNTYFQGGLYATQFYGQAGFYRVAPIFRIHRRINPSLGITLGYLDGNLRHQLPDPLYHFDRYFLHPIENGVQLQYEGTTFTSDTWINWQDFILWGDQKQEQLSFGSRNQVILFAGDPGFSLQIPLTALIHHRGGQINDLDTPMVNILNLHSGLQYQFDVQSKWLKVVETGCMLFYYEDLSPTPQQTHRKGFATSPYIRLQNPFTSWHISYWEGNRFYAPEGNPIFHSGSQLISEGYTNRQIINSELRLFHHTSSGFTAGGMLGLFYDIKHKLPDYHIGLFFAFQQDFFHRKH